MAAMAAAPFLMQPFTAPGPPGRLHHNWLAAGQRVAPRFRTQPGARGQAQRCRAAQEKHKIVFLGTPEVTPPHTHPRPRKSAACVGQPLHDKYHKTDSMHLQGPTPGIQLCCAWMC